LPALRLLQTIKGLTPASGAPKSDNPVKTVENGIVMIKIY
jgi:hypothetical protein